MNGEESCLGGVTTARDKICLVCGDKALGHNFNAVSCESCKAFFRRNALKDKDFKCPFNGKCEITIVTRRFCQLCRLVKCFQVGMKKEYIMSDDDKREKRKKIEEKRGNRSVDDIDLVLNENPSIKRTKTSEQSPPPPRDRPADNLQALSPLMLEPSSPVGSAVSDVKQSGYYDTNKSPAVEIYLMSKSVKPERPVDCNETSGLREEKLGSPRPSPLLSSLIDSTPETSRQSSPFHDHVADEVLRDIPGRKVRIDSNSIDSILSEAIKLEYEAYSSMNPRISSRELNDAERAKLNELIVANKALLAPLEDDVTSFMTQEVMSKSTSGTPPMLVDVLNLTAVAIRRLIKMSKKVNAFKNMCQEDQVALLKGGCTEMMILRSAMTYDPDRGSWKIPRSAENLMNIKVDVLKEAGGRVFDEHQRFLQTFDPRWRNDENIMLILSAITLFTPDRPKVVHHDVIKLEQNSYYYLLRRYLESIYPSGCEARSTFLKLIHKIAELHRLNEDHVRVYMELNPQDVEPLLIEIFDLNRQ